MGLIVLLAAPINKQPDETKPTETVMAHQVQLVEEIEQPQLSKQEVVTAQSTPTQDIPKQTGCEAYREEVSKYDWNINLMLAIAKAESGCRTDAVGDNYPIRGLHAPSCGLFQVRSLKGRPSCEALKDPSTNIYWAYKIYKGQGLKAWSVYTKGLYKNHL